MFAQNIGVDSLHLLFQRPNEPVFTKKDNGRAIFEIPPEFYTERYQSIVNTLAPRHDNLNIRTIPVRSVPFPDLHFTQSLQKHGPFSLFSRKHQGIAGQLIQVFVDIANPETLLNTAAYVRDRVNPYLFQYALAVACQHRSDTKDVKLPTVLEQFPDQFVDSSVFPRAREEGSLVEQEKRQPLQLEINYTASNREPEQRIAYFREDIGVNMHHWHWHLVYPGDGPMEVVNKDRRGELFYYMHSQILARYNNERLCNGLERVKPLNNLRDRIPEGYFPKLVRSVSNRAYPPRVDNALLYDVDRDDGLVEIAELERWRDRVHQAIDQGFVVEQGTNRQIPLDEANGINILGNVLEASRLSPNRQYYGQIHNFGHNLIAYAHDPDNRHLEDYGVMADVATAMRDPVFYRWHSFIDSFCVKFKNTLRPYRIDELHFDGVTITDVSAKMSIQSDRVEPNKLATHLQRSEVELGAGLDFGPGDVYAQFTHLQYLPFEYSIVVTNNSQTTKRGTCRIFLLPRTDERKQPLRFRDQRAYAIEMDKFVCELQPNANEIRRRSSESSVTIAYERSFRRVGIQAQPSDAEELSEFQFCGCGWPQHMLLPKGTPDGTEYDLFVMISDYDQDRVDSTNLNAPCSDGFSFCGLKNQKYPDKRAMGFPFDKSIDRITSLNEFSQQIPNTATAVCKIHFSNRTLNKQ